MDLTLDLPLDAIATATNLAEFLDEPALRDLGRRCRDDYQADLDSRGDWDEKMADALRLAMQVAEEKSYPWQGAANIKFPLLAIAALQFNARAMPAILESPEIVKCQVWGRDDGNQWHERADRISRHMSWQLTNQDYDWEEEMDRALLILPIIGCIFKKIYYRTSEKRNEAELVYPQDVVVDYHTRKLTSETRITHILSLKPGEILSRQRRGLYREMPLPPRGPAPETSMQAVANDRQGTEPPATTSPSDRDMQTPFRVCEQHCLLDLDGDGFPEPYIVTFDETSGLVYRIVARFGTQDIERNFRKEVVGIKARTYFVKYGFIPAPDGGFYDIGFGTLLTPINETVNTAINQLLDAGSMANGAGGFLGRGIRVVGGNSSFRPFEWKRIESTGIDLKQNIFPLPVREPSRVLLDLLTLLVQYAERLTGATDVMVGITPGQNTPAETTRGTKLEAMRVYSAIVKRLWGSLKTELHMLFELNMIYYDTKPEEVRELGMTVPGDYLHSRVDNIVPRADPEIIHQDQRLQRDESVLRMAYSMPGFNRDEAVKRVLNTLRVRDVEQLYIGAEGAPLPNPRLQFEQLKFQAKELSSIRNMHVQIAKMQQQEGLLKSQIDKNEAQAALFLAQAGGEQQGKDIAEFDSMIAAQKQTHESLVATIKLMKELADGRSADFERGLASMEGTPDHPGGIPDLSGQAPGSLGGLG